MRFIVDILKRGRNLYDFSIAQPIVPESLSCRTNSKSEILISKQIQNTKSKCTKLFLGFLSFGFRDCLGFRISRLGFTKAVALVIFIPMLLMATKYAGEFQELGVGGRACAMGGTGCAQLVDPSVVYYNPAGSFHVHRALLVMHAENFAGIVKNEFASVILPRGNMAIGVGLQYLSVSGIQLTTLDDTTSPPSSENPPIPYDTVGTKDMILYINGSRGTDRFSYGANVKVFYRDLSAITAYGGGLDLGCVLNLNYVVIGAAMRDFVLAPIIWSNGTKETVVTKLTFGFSPVIPLEKMNSVVTLECDFVKSLDIEGFDVNVGFELAYKDFIFGRAGIHHGNYAVGVGLKHKKFSIDYALVTHSELKNSNKISAGYTF